MAQFDAVLPPAAYPALAARFNAALPPDVRVVSIHPAPRDFCANGCLWKRYEYTVEGRPEQVLAFSAEVMGLGASQNLGAPLLKPVISEAAAQGAAQGAAAAQAGAQAGATAGAQAGATAGAQAGAFAGKRKWCQLPSDLPPQLDIAAMRAAAKQL